MLFAVNALPLTGELGKRVLGESSENAAYYARATQGWVRPDVAEDQAAAVTQMITGLGVELARWWLTNRLYRWTTERITTQNSAGTGWDLS